MPRSLHTLHRAVGRDPDLQRPPRCPRRQLLQGVPHRHGDRRARLAIDVFCYRIKKYVGAYLAAMNGADANGEPTGMAASSPTRSSVAEAPTTG